MFENIKKLCDSFLNMGIPGFDLIIYKDGECVLRYMGGYSDLESKTPIKGDEKYNIYSCSKPITCVAAMQLWEKGLFSLEDKLSDYMPEFGEMTVKTPDGAVKAQNPILIKHLFEMTAGFSYNVYSPQMERARKETDYKCPTRETMKYLAKEPLLFEPGERWEYSLCHDVLAALVEVISDQRFEEYVRDNIFKPLGMNNSTFLLPERERESLASQYKYYSDTNELKNHGKGNWYMPGSEYASGGAGCVSTVEDYIKFLEALRIGDIILKKETLSLMTTDRLTPAQKRNYWSQDTHGYGLGMRTPKKDGALNDFGWGGAAGAYLAVDIENGITIYYSQHVLTSPNNSLREQLYKKLLEELFDISDFGTISEENIKNKQNTTY